MKVETNVEIACPPEALWPWLVEPERMKQWLKGLLEVRPLGAPVPRQGAEFELVIREGGRTETYREKIVEFEPQRRLAIELSGGCWKESTMSVEYVLEDLGSRTRLDYRMNADFRGWMKLLVPLFGIFGCMQLRSVLRKLKSLAESSASATAAL